MLRRIVFVAVLAAAPSFARAAGPTIDIVVGPQAEAIEKYAADEMAGQLKKLFDAEVRIGESAPADAANVIYLGTKESCPIAAKLGDAWPKLSDQGHALKTIEVDGCKALLVAGGSPRAAMWAAYEYGWKNGVRYFLFGDLYPVTKPTFTVEGFDAVIEPKETNRRWAITGEAPYGVESWDLATHFSVLRQSAKLGYNELVIDLPGWESGTPMHDIKIRVDGDTAGRAAFKGARLFENPEFSAGESIAARQAIGKRLLSELRSEGERLGMVVKFLDLSLPPDPPGTQSPSRTGDMLRELCDDLFQYQSEFRSFGTLKYDPRTFNEWLDPVCGEGVATRVGMANDLVVEAMLLLQTEGGFHFSAVDEQMLLKHYDSEEPPPAWWGEVRTHYLNAMNEMYRANTRAREGGRAFTLYYARRFEFGFEYMNAVEAVRNAGIAKRKGDRETQIAELEKAIDSVTNACNAMAAVSRSQSDRGIIAVMNEYGYRPLLKLLEEADAAP